MCSNGGAWNLLGVSNLYPAADMAAESQLAISWDYLRHYFLQTDTADSDEGCKR